MFLEGTLCQRRVEVERREKGDGDGDGVREGGREEYKEKREGRSREGRRGQGKYLHITQPSMVSQSCWS